MRREPLLAALLCVAGSFLVLVAGGRPWVELGLVSTPLLPAQALGVTGSDLAPGLRALGLAGLAGVPALAATRGRGRILVGAVLAAVGLGVLGIVLRLAVRDGGLTGAAQATQDSEVLSSSVSAWPWACLLGAVLLTGAGLLVALRGRRWATLGRRYETPSVARQPVPATGPVAERELWEALDRGHDPTGEQVDTDPDGRETTPRG